MSNNIFSEVVYNNIPRNHFDLSHDKKLSCNMGELVPILTQEVSPGDIFKIQTEHLLRLQAMITPMMHRVKVSIHYWFVPNRLIWSGWEDFITNPTTTDKVQPYYRLTSAVYDGSLGDYLGYPTGAEYEKQVNILPVAAYLKIWDDWYRDQNLQQKKMPDTQLVDGDNSAENAGSFIVGPPLARAWNHDYFTSCLPDAQQGDPVLLPLGESAPILYEPDGATYSKIANLPAVDGAVSNAGGAPISGGSGFSIDNSENLIADLTNATAVTINDLRRASALQRYLEINMRSGTRPIEFYKAHFGVSSKDSRLQMAEYIGGGISTVSISEVLQTSESADETPLGEMAGHGINIGGAKTNRPYVAEEHGFIIGIMSIMPETSYLNPTPKWAIRQDPMDYMVPSLANIGEQEVRCDEVDGTFPSAAGGRLYTDTFGYIPRYSEYRFNHNTVHGYFKSNLDFWHMARRFESLPALNSTFIECNPTHRVFAVADPNVHKVLVHIVHKIDALRCLPKHNIPNLM